MENKYLQEDLALLAKEIDRLGLRDCSILVTGATGLIGSLLIRAMMKANELYKVNITIKAVCRSGTKLSAIIGGTEHLTLIEQDVTCPLNVEADYIIHTANPTSSAYFMSNPVETMDSICLGSRNVLELARKCGAKGVVYLSSMETFGVVEISERITEKQLGYIDISNIRACYSEGKRLAECMCKCFAVEYGVPVRIARLAQVFGAGVAMTEKRVFAQFARSAVAGDDIVLHTTGESVGNYCYTRDAIRAIFLLLTAGENGEAYTVVNEDNTMSIADMAHLVAANFSDGRSNVVFDIPKENCYGYAPGTKMRLSGAKMRELGWNAEVGMIEMYRRMLPDLK